MTVIVNTPTVSAGLVAGLAFSLAVGIASEGCAARENDGTNAALECSANLEADPLNCGACGHACEGPPGIPVGCAAGACSFDCPGGTWDCDGDAANGCETPLPACVVQPLTGSVGRGFLVDASNAYWRDDIGTLKRSALTGAGGVTPTVDLTTIPWVDTGTLARHYAMAQDTTSLYVVGGGFADQMGIYRVSKVDGVATRIFPHARPFLLHDGDLFVIGRSALQDFQLERRSAQTGELAQAWVFAPGLTEGFEIPLTPIGVDDSYAYVVELDAKLWRVPLAGGAATMLFESTSGSLRSEYRFGGGYAVLGDDYPDRLYVVAVATGAARQFDGFRVDDVETIGRYLILPNVSFTGMNVIDMTNANDLGTPLVVLPNGFTIHDVAVRGNSIYVSTSGGLAVSSAP